MKNKKSVAVITFSIFLKDDRILNEVKTLVDSGYDVVIYDRIDNAPTKELKHNNITIKIYSILDLGLLSLFKKSNRIKMLDKILKQKTDIIHCHDFQALFLIGPVIKKLISENIQLIYDSHEYFKGYPPYPLINELNLITKLKLHIVNKYYLLAEKKYIKHFDYVITVGDEIAQILRNENKLKNPVVVVKNISMFKQSDNEIRFNLRTEFNIPRDHFIFIFVGKYAPGWDYCEEQFYSFMNRNEKVSLVLLLREVNESRSSVNIREFGISDRVFIKAPVKKELVPAVMNAADASLIPIWNPKVPNLWYSCPNKLFDSILSRKPLFATCQPEYKNVVEQFNNGLCYNPEKKDDMCEKFENLKENYDIYLHGAELAKNHFKWENEAKKLLQIYETFCTQ